MGCICFTYTNHFLFKPVYSWFIFNITFPEEYGRISMTVFLNSYSFEKSSYQLVKFSIYMKKEFLFRGQKIVPNSGNGKYEEWKINVDPFGLVSLPFLFERTLIRLRLNFLVYFTNDGHVFNLALFQEGIVTITKTDPEVLVNVDAKTRSILKLTHDCRQISAVTVTLLLDRGKISRLLDRSSLNLWHLWTNFICVEENRHAETRIVVPHRANTPSTDRLNDATLDLVRMIRDMVKISLLHLRIIPTRRRMICEKT